MATHQLLLSQARQARMPPTTYLSGTAQRDVLFSCERLANAQPPEGLRAWRTVYHYFRLWKRNGLSKQIHTHLREHLRQVKGRQRQAIAGIIGSQSVKSNECSEQRGYDAGKKVNGRKRHVPVDTLA